MSKGVLIYAHNNKEIDYVSIAIANTYMIKHNLGLPVTLVTDSGSIDWVTKSKGRELINSVFDNIILVDRLFNYEEKNIRQYKDTSFSIKHLPFINYNHYSAYDLSPYEETLFIDADYLIMSDSLSKCFGSNEDFMINSEIHSLDIEKNVFDTHIDDFGIKLYWATCIYFKKSQISETIFTLVKHVYDNYSYYRQLYLIPRGLFRNDYAFSIAVHMVNGFVDNELISALPSKILFMSDKNDIVSVKKNDITFLLENNSSYVLTKIKEQDVHIMNKWAINRHADTIIKVYNE